MQAPASSVDDAASFLAFLHGRGERGNLVIARKPVAGPEAFRADAYPVTCLEGAAAMILALTGGAEVYVSVSAFAGERRTLENALHTYVLWLDRDDRPLSGKLPTPTLTLETSPGRYQVFWLLARPIQPDVAEDCARRIAHACGCGAEAVAANQVVRLPGTINHGIGKGRSPFVVRVAHYFPYALYSIGNFKRLPPALALPPAPVQPVLRSRGIVDGLAALRRAYPHMAPRMRACAAGEGINKPDGSPYPSESERDQALITAFVRIGLTNEEATAAFIETHRGHMLVARKRDRDPWARLMRMAAKARKWLADNGFEEPDGIPYVRVGRSVLEHAHILGPEGLAVMLVLSLHANRADEAWPTQGTIAAFLNCSPDLVGDQIRHLRDDLGMIGLVGKVGRAHVHTLIATGSDPMRIPRHLLLPLEGQGALPLVIIALAVAQAAVRDAPNLTQSQLADRLGIARKRINPVINRLVEAGLLQVARRGARGLRFYGVVDARMSVCPSQRH